MCIQSIYNYNSNHNNYHNVVVAFYNTTGIPIGGDDDAYYYHDEINNNNGNDNDNHMDDINTTYDTIHVGDNAIRNGNVVGNDDIDVYNYHYLPFVNFEHLQFIGEIQNNYKNADNYNNLQYILGTLVSCYGIYQLVIRITEAICKKNELVIN